MIRSRFTLLLPALLVMGVRAPALAQTPQDSAQAPPAALTPSPAPTIYGPPAPLLDRPINRATYVLGAGDEVSIAILGDVTRVHSVPVLPEGTVLVPTVGIVRVGGLNLDEAESRVRSAVLRYYRNIEVRLSLSRVREFKVFVVGNVEGAGVRTASAVTRVSEVVPGLAPTGVIRRNVLLRRASGDTMSVDLARFLLAGDLTQDPPVREGDVLVVPAADQTVRVQGRVAYPGSYEYRRGESVAELLALVNGGAGFPANAADTVRLSRFVTPYQQEVIKLSLAEAGGARGRGLPLQPFDAIFVPEISNFKVQRTAAITGQVVNAGVYPIRPDTTTVGDLIALAGGLRPEASLGEATLRRDVGVRSGAAATAAGQAPEQGAFLEALSPDERRVIQINNQAVDSYVALDLTRPAGTVGSGLDQRLRSGDVLTVPERRNEVTVLGAVVRPGIVSFVPGQPLSHYVGVAGGFSREADRGDLMVLRPKTRARLNWRDVQVVEPGDRIVVPYRERRTVLERVQTFQGVLGTISGTILSILAFRQLF